MRSVLYIVRRPPGPLADEATDLMFVSGVFEQPTSVLFTGDGVRQLVGLADRQSSVKALPTYDVEALHVAADALAQRGLTKADLGLPVRLADEGAVRELLRSHDVIITD